MNTSRMFVARALGGSITSAYFAGLSPNVALARRGQSVAAPAATAPPAAVARRKSRLFMRLLRARSLELHAPTGISPSRCPFCVELYAVLNVFGLRRSRVSLTSDDD